MDPVIAPESTPVVVPAEQKPAPAPEVSSVSVESPGGNTTPSATPDDVAVAANKAADAGNVEVPVSFQDTDFDGADIPEAFLKAFPKFAGKLNETLKNLREAADNNKLLEDLLRDDPAPADDKALKAAQKEWEQREAKYKEELSSYQAKMQEIEIAKLQAEVQAQVPDIYDFAGDKGDYPALAKYIDLVSKGIDNDVAAAQVRKSFNMVSSTTPTSGAQGCHRRPRVLHQGNTWHRSRRR